MSDPPKLQAVLLAIADARLRQRVACTLAELIQPRCIEVKSLSEALAVLARELAIEVAVLDGSLASAGAPALVRRIRAQNDRLPAIALAESDSAVAEAIAAGACDGLTPERLGPATLTRALHQAHRHRQAQQQIEAAHQQLRESEARYRSFLQGAADTVSHELRTPMNAILGFSQLLLRQGPSGLTLQQQQMLERIHSNSQALLALINDILALAQLEAGRLRLEPAPFDLRELARSTVEELRSLAEQKQLALVLESELADPYTRNDRRRVRQLLTHLIANAIKFTPMGRVTVELRERSPQTLELAVRDTGIGLSERQQAQAFDRFWQRDGSTTRHHGGTGSGLAIVRALAERMQGQVWVESAPGQGSRFGVVLPRRVGTASSLALPRETGPSPHAAELRARDPQNGA
ncbi:MAG: hybrid sensor histidine kinase/response regulator [Cyanobacteria bacterium QS_8_64_29]|nr:MAG: hybrid sensor histidine kinase/response regulator [Cyanobacteria bacterium QS_8_64_29]